MFCNNEIKFADRSSAITYLYTLAGEAVRYGKITCADIYEDFGIDAAYTDTKLGWTADTIVSANICRKNTCYTIELPDPVPVDTLKNCKNSPPKEPSRDILNITVNTNELKNPDAALAGIFKCIPHIKDRVINITIM